jgi:hypothetical protein
MTRRWSEQQEDAYQDGWDAGFTAGRRQSLFSLRDLVLRQNWFASEDREQLLSDIDRYLLPLDERPAQEVKHG